MLIRGEYQTPPLLCCVKKGDLRGGGEGEAYSASGWMGNHGNICSGLEVHVRVCWVGHAKTGTSCRQREG